MTHYTQSDYTTSSWAGGSTTQLGIYPPDKKYQDRDFLWRISKATVEVEQSDFTRLPEYHRFIAPTENELTLEHDGDGRTIVVAPFQVHSFDGGQETFCQGKGGDVNLMVRQGVCKGELIYQSVSGKRSYAIAPPLAEHMHIAVYCPWGAVVVQGHDLHQGDMLLLDEHTDTLSLIGLGQLFIATMEW